MSLRAKRPRLNQRLSLEMPIRGLSWTGVRFSAPPPEEEASNSSFTRTSLRLCIGWGTPDGVPFPFSLPRNAVFCVLRRCKPAGVLVYHSGFFRALKRLWSGLRDIRAPMCISRSLDARVAALRAAVGCGRTYRRGAAWAWEVIRPSVWSATTALRASVAFEKVRMRHAKPYWMVSMLFAYSICDEASRGRSPRRN